MFCGDPELAETEIQECGQSKLAADHEDGHPAVTVGRRVQLTARQWQIVQQRLGYRRVARFGRVQHEHRGIAEEGESGRRSDSRIVGSGSAATAVYAVEKQALLNGMDLRFEWMRWLGDYHFTPQARDATSSTASTSSR